MDDTVTGVSRRRFAIGIIGLTAAMAFPGVRRLGAAPRPAPHAPITRKFNVLWGKDAIGVHQIQIAPAAAAGSWEVRVGIDLLIDLGLFGEISYRHASWETWRDGRIAELVSWTDDDGEVCEVTGRAVGDHFRMSRPSGSFEAPGNLLTSNSAWSEEICRESRIIDATTGTVVHLKARRQGGAIMGAAAGGSAREYELSCPMIAGSFWYDEAGLWIRSRLNRSGVKIDYILDA